MMVKEFLFVVVGMASFLSQATQQIETTEFWLCTQERAKGVQVRSLRIHKFPAENNRCLSLYSRSGQDKVVANGKWFGFCQKIVNQVRQNLEKNLWNCQELKLVPFFYSQKEKPS